MQAKRSASEKMCAAFDSSACHHTFDLDAKQSLLLANISVPNLEFSSQQRDLHDCLQLDVDIGYVVVLNV
jgi:hypothetical protein